MKHSSGDDASPSLSIKCFQSSLAAAGDDNSLFTKWRPQGRFLAPAGWMNDPNGAVYDPATDVYHLFYQWNPNHVIWGNISWGHATSKDLITWKDVPHQGSPAWQDANAQALGTMGGLDNYNGVGIYSGTAQPVSLNGAQDGTLLAFYTSVSSSRETQSIALSKDGGASWDEYEGNPVIRGKPEGWDMTGFRDPFFEPWPEMDEVLGNEAPHYYVTIGGGIKGVGPRALFYSAPASALTQWTFLGALWEPKVRELFGPHSGSWGVNFEMPNFFSLKDAEGNTRFYLGIGNEGGELRSLYSEGIISRRDNGSAAFQPVSGGVLDWGNLYALTSFVDPKSNNRRVQWGWSAEDFPGKYARQQGFQGAFALPRELSPLVTKDLLDPDGKLKDSGAYVTQQPDGKFTASVLGIRPLEDVVQGLRKGAEPHSLGRRCSFLARALNTGSPQLELAASFPATSKGGFIVAASPSGEEYTEVYYDPATSEIVVIRTHTTTLADFNSSPIKGYFYPFTTADGTENIKLRVFVDGSLLEVYANDRFALTTRIYADRSDSTGYGLYSELEEGQGVQYEDASAWVGAVNVWPDRPANSSSQIVVD